MASLREGTATPDGTRRAAARFGADVRTLGPTGLVVAPIGIGTHLLRDGDVLHARTLRSAIEGGMNLVHVCDDERSALLVGRVLEDAEAGGRDELVIVVELGTAWEDLAPERLEQALGRTRERLRVAVIDVVLLRVPATARAHEHHAMLGGAFAWAAAQCRRGSIGAWGIASEGMAEPPRTGSHLAIATLLELAVDPYGLGVLAVPINAFELGALIDEPAGAATMRAAADAGLAVIGQRPFTARFGAEMIRLADPRGPAPAVAAALAELRKLEAAWAVDLGRRIATDAGDATDLFRWGQALAQSHARALDHAAWQQIRYDVIAPHVGRSSAALLAHLQGADRDAFAAWWQAYGTALHHAFTAIEADLAMTPVHRIVAEAIDPVLPEAWRSLPLVCRAAGVVISAPVSAAVVGLRAPSQVAQWLALGAAPPIAGRVAVADVAGRTRLAREALACLRPCYNDSEPRG